MIVATDVHYLSESEARAAAVVFDSWTADTPVTSYTDRATDFGPYVAGRFYERELPCLLPLLHWVLAAHDVHTVIVDGYVNLGDRPGLGLHLAHALERSDLRPAIVGVAKTAFEGAPAEPVVRGTGSTPLWITARGMHPTRAAERVRSMHGRFRLPTLLLLVDHIARGLADPH